jgi:predicted enzyme related to lactoylglutathione lyase
MRDVAKLAGVSAMTVSRALNRPDLVRATTLAKIMEVIDSLSYQPNSAARTLATGRSKVIGVITAASTLHRARAHRARELGDPPQRGTKLDFVKFAILAAMGPVVRYLMVDCLGNPHQLASFWGAVPRRPVRGAPEGCFVELHEGGPELSLFFQDGSGRQQAKGWLHLHLNPVEGTLAEEIARLTGLGAAVVSRHARGDELGWVVMTDPEGNEFCVDSSDAEVAAFRYRHGITED